MRSLCLLAAVFVAGCGDDAPGPPRFDLSMPSMIDMSFIPVLSNNAAATIEVGPGGTNAFVPSTLTIHTGESVAWHWVTGSHSIISDSTPKAFDDSPIQSSGIYLATFPSAGTFPYHCGVHGSMMTGTITVQ